MTRELKTKQKQLFFVFFFPPPQTKQKQKTKNKQSVIIMAENDSSSASVALSEACIAGSIDQALDLIEGAESAEAICGTPVPWTDSDGKEFSSPPIFVAIDYGHLELVEALLPFHRPNLIDTLTDGDGEYTALSWASFAGHLDIVKLLVEDGKATVNDEPVSLAREYEHWEIAEYLAQRADLYSELGGDLDAIMDKACREGDGAKVKQILEEEDYDISKWKDEEGKYLALSPMYMAVKFGHYDVIQIFAGLGIQVDLPSQEEQEAEVVPPVAEAEDEVEASGGE